MYISAVRNHYFFCKTLQSRNVLLFNVEFRHTPLQYFFFVATTGIEPVTVAIILPPRYHFSMSHVKETLMHAINTPNVLVAATFLESNQNLMNHIQLLLLYVS